MNLKEIKKVYDRVSKEKQVGNYVVIVTTKIEEIIKRSI